MSTPTALSVPDLLPNADFQRVTSLVVRDNDGIEEALAEHIIAEALKFVAMAAKRGTLPIVVTCTNAMVLIVSTNTRGWEKS